METELCINRVSNLSSIEAPWEITYASRQIMTSQSNPTRRNESWNDSWHRGRHSKRFLDDSGLNLHTDQLFSPSVERCDHAGTGLELTKYGSL
jgi:hypothetical protein